MACLKVRFTTGQGGVRAVEPCRLLTMIVHRARLLLLANWLTAGRSVCLEDFLCPQFWKLQVQNQGVERSGFLREL